MRKLKTYLVLVASLILLANEGFAQDGQYIEVRDFETWTSGKVGLELNKKWEFAVQGQMRLDKNSAELDRWLTEVTMGYKFLKHFELAAGLRYTSKNDNEGAVQGNEPYLRYHFDGSFKHDVKRFDFKYRLRYTNSNELGISRTEGDIPVRYIRLKTSVGYNIKNWKLDPELSGEIFNRQVQYGQSNGFDQFRVTIGTSYKTKGYGKIGVYYRLQREITSFYPKTSNIIRIKYSYTFKKSTQ